MEGGVLLCKGGLCGCSLRRCAGTVEFTECNADGLGDGLPLSGDDTTGMGGESSVETFACSEVACNVFASEAGAS